MALEITAQNDAKLIISGTTTELATIYARIEFACPKNGETMQGALYNYATKSEYDTSPNALLRLDAFQTSYAITIDVATQQQSLETGHESIKTQLEAIGYSVVIVDLS